MLHDAFACDAAKLLNRAVAVALEVVAGIILELLNKLHANATTSLFFHRSCADLKVACAVHDEIERLAEPSDSTDAGDGTTRVRL